MQQEVTLPPDTLNFIFTAKPHQTAAQWLGSKCMQQAIPQKTFAKASLSVLGLSTG